MPHVKQVHSLYFQCLNCIFESLYEVVSNGVDSKTLERMRKHFVTNLHGGIREHILKLAVLKDKNRIHVLLQLINLLIDSSVGYLCPVSGTGYLLADHYSTLIHHLRNRECTGLKSLYIKVGHDRPKNKEEEIISKANKLFYSLLVKGLAKNLTVLVLETCCDNEILKLLGQNCMHLTKLNVTNSWSVNDNGCKYLCLKDPDCIPDIVEGDTHTPQLLLNMMSMKPETLNQCCFTLCDIRIQDTNTSDIAVLMLLIFIRNLKTLGGFIYFRSVGDNIVYLSRLAQEKLKLNLTELWDTHLTDSKLQHLSAVLPNLSSIYTRCMHLQLVTRFSKLSEIIIDFDFNHYEDVFFNFLASSGKQLRTITLKDQAGYIDLPKILESCPNLIEINCAVKMDSAAKSIQALRLIKANIKTTEIDVVEWIFDHTPNLEHFEVELNYHREFFTNYTVVFDNGWLKDLIERKPQSLNSLKYFILNSSESRTFKQKTVLKFILECQKLKHVGDFHTWAVPIKGLNGLRSALKDRNLDVNILYKSDLVPYITMQNIKEFNALKDPYKSYKML
ncbi:uncharacterized protein LOC135838347 [Planococcus citri]|uniref:uncharacterized protein LOC135838347 n=1 Tax=Planococcus citri TaxID=170843 RepID=UPI0031F9DF20